MKKQLFFISVFTIISIKLLAQYTLGIDVSHNNGTINWSQISVNKVFAWAKATEGYTFNDPNFSTNMVNGSNAGVVMGAYHFARPDNNTAVDEANHFVSIAGSYIGTGFLPPVLDLEDPTASNGNIINLQSLFTSAHIFPERNQR